MKTELLILRHAKSAWNTNARSDFDRPLAKRGRESAPRVGRFLKRQGLVPDYVVSSPARRAKQTVLMACEEMGVSAARIHWDERIYSGWTSALLTVLRESPESARRVMIAGHNPGLENLLSALSSERVDWPDDGKLLPTAAVAHLSFDRNWADLDRSSGKLLSITRVRWLDEAGAILASGS